MQHRDTVPKKAGWLRGSACRRHGAPAAGAPHLTARCPARCSRYREREFSVSKSAHSTHRGFTHGLLLGKRCPSSAAGMGKARCCLAPCAQDVQECLGCYGCCSSSAPNPTSASTWRFTPVDLQQGYLGLMVFFTAKLLPARPPVPGMLSPRSCELLPQGAHPAWVPRGH